MTEPAITVSITRGPAVESRHAVHAVIMDGAGKIVHAYGDPKRATFPRSCIKPLQAIALVESGAAAQYGVTNAELALACASHGGEKMHTDTASAWLARLGLDETALECGAHAPYFTPCDAPCVLCNNCSGKHSGMVTLALGMGVDHRGYTDPRHPAQAKILATLGEMCGVTVTPESCGIDGCSAPNPVMALADIARGFARFMKPDTLGIKRGTACRHLYQAMVEYPELVAGTGRLDTALMVAAKGDAMAKIGGEGVYACVLPRMDRVVVLKAEDGAHRATQAALFMLLEKYKLVSGDVLSAIHGLCLPVLKNWRGLETGEIRV